MENNNIAEKVNRLLDEINFTLAQCKRSKNDLSIMAVTKNATVEQIIQAREAGLELFGENYINSAQLKIPLLLKNNLFSINQFHCIGHLQSNKVKKALTLFSSIDSVDSINLISEIQTKVSVDKPYSIMLEVKTSQDDSKFGFAPSDLLKVFPEIISFKNVNVTGFMTISTLNGSEKETRRCFSELRKTKELIESAFSVKIPFLSMGMSEDYKFAIQEGSNMLRLGRAIFGG